MEARVLGLYDSSLEERERSFTYLLGQHLARRNYDVHVICAEQDPAKLPFVSEALCWDLDQGSVSVFRTPRVSGLTIHMFPRGDMDDPGEYERHVALLEAIVDRARLTLLHCTQLLPDALVCTEAAALCNVPLMVHVRAREIDSLATTIRAYTLAEQTLWAAQGVICSTDSALRRLQAIYPWLGTDVPVAVVGAGASTPSRLQRSTRPSSEIRIVYAGPVVRGNGLEVAIAAMPAIVAANPDAHLVVHRTGPDGQLMRSLVQALASGAPDRLHALLHTSADRAKQETDPESSLLPPVALYADEPETADLLFSCPTLADHIHFADASALFAPPLSVPEVSAEGEPSQDSEQSEERDGEPSILDCADLLVFPMDTAHVLEGLSHGALPIVNSASEFEGITTAMVAVLEKALVNRLRIPTHPALQVLSLASSVNRLLEDRDALAALAPNLCAFVQDQHNWSARAAEMEAAYSRFLSPP